MANNFNVKVNVEFNAIMGRLNNALEDFKAKLATVGDAIGNKNIGTQLSNEFEKTVKKLNELNNTNITPNNVENYKRKLAELQDRLEKLKELQKELASTPFSVDINAKKKELEDKQKELQDLLNNNKGVNFRKSREWFAENAPDLQEQKETYLRLQREIKKLTNEYNEADTAQKNYTDGTKILNQVVEDAEQGTNKATDALEEYTVQEEKAANERLANTIQTQVTRFIGLNAIYRYSKKYIQDLIKTYKEFDQSLVAIAAVTGQTRDQMWANIGVYNKMAQSLGTTTQEVINASKLYYQQGLTTTSVLKLTEETVKLATIAELDSADATEYLTTAMNGFKLSAEESTRVTDVWANLAAKTASDVDELAVAISKVASLAENAGMEIETASAFLNQMIETTREAPENLGTALKTIIARFQELKVSEEALSDGVDANKVEKALKSANVELRDATGQFRDFDEVILDLSAKWNTLDRNTQRYIATIAAGSRQQSRFIAMVSDYEGLLRNVNYAYDSLGSADAQMAVFQEGLEASTNRLQAAWEGLYTSWSKSATVISKLIDFSADFISTLGDLGAGTSALIAIGGLLIARILAGAAAREIEGRKIVAATIATAQNTKATLLNALAQAIASGADANRILLLTALILKTNKYIAAQKVSTAQSIKQAIAQAGIIAKYIAMAAVIAAVTYAIIKVINQEKDYIKLKEKETQQLTQLAAQEKDRASNLGVLIEELKNAKDSEEKLEEVRQKIIDQFGEELTGINVETKSYEELIEVLQKLQKEKELLASKDYIAAAEARKESEFYQSDIYKKLSSEKYNESSSRKLFVRKGINGIDKETGKLSYGAVFVYKGKPYSDINKLKEAIQADGEDIDLSLGTLSKAETRFVAKSILDSDEIKTEFKEAQTAVESFVKFLDDQGKVKDLFDEDGNLNKDYINQIQALTNDIENLYNTIEKEQGKDYAKDFLSFVSGDYSNLTTDQITDFSNKIASVTNATWAQVGQENADHYIEGLKNKWAQFDANLSSDLVDIAIAWTGNLQSAFMERFKDADLNTRELAIKFVDSFQEETGKALSSLDGDELWEQYVNAVADAGDEGVSDKLRDAFHNLLDFSEVSFDHAADQIRGLSQALSQLHDVTQDGLDIDSYISLISELAAEMDDATLATLAENMAIDATTGKVKMNEEVARGLAKAKIAQARGQLEAGKTAAQEQLAELLAVKAAREAGDGAASLGSVMNGLADDTSYAAKVWSIFQAVLHNKMSLGEAWDAVKTLWSEVTTTTSRAITALQKYGKLSDEELQGEIDKAQTLYEMYDAGITSLDKIDLDSYISQTKKTGSSTSKTDDASKKYLETLKKLADQLKETAEEAEAAAKREIAAILAVLEAEKAKLEEMQKEREEWRDKESEELELWIKAQIALLQEEQKAQEKAYQDNEDALSLQAEAAQTYYNQQIEAIQAKIDALDAESEAEDRLLKLQQARDAYNKAQNSKSRLVLTKGAGWIFKADQKEVADARKQLQDVQREIQKAAYQDQIDELQKQADEWEKIADGIGKSAEEIAKLAAAVEEFGKNAAAGTGYADLDAFTKAVEALQEQKATMDFNADETAAGSLAYQIAQLEEALEKVGRSFEDQLLAERLEAITEVLRGQNEEQGYADTTGQILGHVETYMQEFSKVAHEYSETAAKIAEIEKSIELWKSIDENLGLTVEEIEEAKKLYDKYSKKFEKFGTKAFDEQSKAYKAMLDKIGEIAKYFSEAKEAEEKAKTYEEATKNGFSSGGVVDFYGPADLHGTIAEPEVVFNARQASALFNWVKSLSSFGIPQINGVNPTPVVTTSNNSMRTNTISIGELYINSSANNFDGLVADITRNSMLRQPI